MSSNITEVLHERARCSIWKSGSEATQNELLRRCGFPRFLQKAEGCFAWDIEGKRYVDYLMGWGSVLLGHGHSQVVEAVIKQMKHGAILNLGTELEISLAERLIDYLPGANLVRFLATGSEATNAAVRLARAATGANKIVRCGYHGWHDWCLTENSAGIPEYITDDTLSFTYNDLDSLRALPALQNRQVACIIMEPVKHVTPSLEFLAGVKDTAHKSGALLVFDEIKTGFRLGLGGAQKKYGVTPDLSLFGKALGNGYPISVVAGKQRVFLDANEVWITGTFHNWPPAIAAAHATLTFLEGQSSPTQVEILGQYLIDGFNYEMEKRGLDLRLGGCSPMPLLNCPKSEQHIVEEFVARLVDDGIFVHPTQPWYVSFSHTREIVEDTLRSIQRNIDIAIRNASLPK